MRLTPRRRRTPTVLAILTDDNWTCGDCGTEWPDTITACENVEQDRAAVAAAHAALPESRRVGL